MPPAHRRLRLLLDAFWIVAFVGLVLWMQLRPSSPSASNATVPLELKSGAQRQGLYRNGDRLGAVVFDVSRVPKGWELRHEFLLGRRSGAHIRMHLRADLSLSSLQVQADLVALADLVGLPPALMREMGGRQGAQLRLQGECSGASGVCQLVGALGTRRLRLPITAGRGPVVTGAIYPLLARGSLGRKAEVTVFDPLALRQHVVAFTVQGRERLRLRRVRCADGGPCPTAAGVSCADGQACASMDQEATIVRRDLAGVTTRVWIDSRGLVLREEMPLGVVLEHESWRPHD
jgi:hypothetical protein